MKQHGVDAADECGASAGDRLPRAGLMASATERVVRDIAARPEWRLTPPEQVAVLRLRAAPSTVTPAFAHTTERAAALLGEA